MLRSIKQEQLKHDLHNELQTQYKAFFESQLAIYLLKHPDYFPSVKKISTIITKLITSNKSTVLNIIRENPKIIAELSEPYFGSCLDSKEVVSEEIVYEKMIAILDKQSDLSCIMQMHCIFIYRIYDHIERKLEKTDLVNTLFPPSLFNRENRSRIENKEEAKPITHLGITNHPVFSSRLEKHEKKHIRALDKYTLDKHSVFSQSAIKKRIPIVCGPSGHTASLLLGAKLYGELTASELKEYALASFAFLTAGGHHSFYEVFMIANLLGVTYESDNYAVSIPESIMATENYKTMLKRFPEFL